MTGLADRRRAAAEVPVGSGRRARTGRAALSARRRWTAALVASGLLVSPASAASGQEDEDDAIPVAGTFSYHLLHDDSQPEVRGAVHAVRRVPGGTAVYYSLGVAEGGSWQPTASMPPPNLADDYPFGAAASVSLVDTRGLRLYQPMVGPQGCLCPDLGELGQEAGVLHVGWALMAPLPPDVDTVSVEVGYGPQIEDVPVGDGPLTPEQPAPSTQLGQGWPALPDAAAVASVPDPARYVRALVRNVSDTEQRVTTAERPGRVDESLAADVLFAVDSATLTPEARSTLEALAGRLRERATGPITVTGHTDSSGEPGYNVQLSTARAQAVLDALRPGAGPSAQFVAAGQGEQEPVADNATPEGRALNRRVTVTYSVEGP